MLAQPLRLSAKRSIATTVSRQLQQNFKPQQAIEPTSFTSFAQYRLKASQHDPLTLLDRKKHLQEKKPVAAQIEIKDDYYSFDNKFKQIARDIEYKNDKK